MTKTHVVCKSVDRPALDRAESRREEHGIAAGIFLEKKELRVIGERCAVIQIDLCNESEISISNATKALELSKQISERRMARSDLPSFWPRCETGEGDVAGMWDVREDMEL
jgi:hypothetical protein